MKERPIPYSPDMVRARRAGLKTQSRRGIKWKDVAPGLNLGFSGLTAVHVGGGRWVLESPTRLSRERRCAPTLCPYGAPGDRLWVREAYRVPAVYDGLPPRKVPIGCPVWYEADGPAPAEFGRYRHAKFMCRWMSRGLDEVISVRAEPVTSICFADAVAEGVSGWVHHPKCSTAQDGYRLLWESINGAGSWSRKQWVWAIEFKVLA